MAEFCSCGGFFSWGDRAARVDIEHIAHKLEKEVAGLKFDGLEDVHQLQQQIVSKLRAGGGLAKMVDFSSVSVSGARVKLDGELIGVVSMVCAGRLFDASHLFMFLGFDDPKQTKRAKALDRIADSFSGNRIDLTKEGKRQFVFVGRGANGLEAPSMPRLEYDAEELMDTMRDLYGDD